MDSKRLVLADSRAMPDDVAQYISTTTSRSGFLRVWRHSRRSQSRATWLAKQVHSTYFLHRQRSSDERLSSAAEVQGILYAFLISDVSSVDITAIRDLQKYLNVHYHIIMLVIMERLRYHTDVTLPKHNFNLRLCKTPLPEKKKGTWTCTTTRAAANDSASHGVLDVK